MKVTTTTLVQIVIDFENADERKSFNEFQMGNEVFAQYTALRAPKRMIGFFDADDAAKIQTYIDKQKKPVTKTT